MNPADSVLSLASRASLGASPLARPAAAPRADDQRAFESLLGRSQAQQGGRPDRASIRDAAENFVSIALVQPVFKQLRSTNRTAAPFAPTRAEQQFQSMIDSRLAKHMVHSSRWPLVDRIEQSLLQRSGLAPASLDVQS